MSLSDRFSAAPDPIPRANAARPQHPSGWEPRVDTAGASASIITQPTTEASADEALLLLGSNLDPAEWAISSEVQTRRWQQRPGDEWLHYYKFNATRRGSAHDDGWEDAIARLAKHKPKRPDPRPIAHARVICLADWQAGKGEGGGSTALAARIEHLISESVAMVKREKPDVVYLVGMGDMVERCEGNYPSQMFTTDLNERQQERFARRAILALVQAIAPHTPRVVLSCVPGNHGENRRNGKAITDSADNADVAVFEAVSEALRLAPAYDHVTSIIPEGDLVVTLDIAGTPVAFAHGHQFGGGSGPQAKAIKWWEGQAMGRLPAGDADVLVSGHYHHLQVCESHGRLWMQCPSLDGGSEWFTTRTGQWSMAGTLTFRVDANGPRDIQVIQSPVVP